MTWIGQCHSAMTLVGQCHSAEIGLREMRRAVICRACSCATLVQRALLGLRTASACLKCCD
eukprot:scaffold272148_cov19-Tisochrysis_lutea.AAC.1